MSVYIDEEKCTGCGICEEVCPGDIIRVEGKKPMILVKECWHCGCCELDCPQGVFQVHPWLRV